MNSFTEYSKNYSKIPSSSWNYYKDEPSDPITNSKYLKFNTTITLSTTNNNDQKEIEIAVTLKYFSHFWRTLKRPLTVK